MPQNEQLVVSRYVEKPLLVNGLKFDLRLYVVLTSLDPLRIYIYNEGLVRFASEPYRAGAKDNLFCHLTNYSINKKNDQYVSNSKASENDIGNKWSMSALQKHLEMLGIETNTLWTKIYDALLKTFLSVESQLSATGRKGVSGRNCFELYGFDILIDEQLQPWILEVNLSPSLVCDTPLDFHIKANLVVDTFNLVGLKKFKRSKEALGKKLK